MNTLTFEHVSKRYAPDTLAVDDISLSINQGDFVTILGPSGCGKSTVLRMINKLIPFDEGSITIDGQCISTMDTVALRRSIGYVIQHVALFPHYTVRENIGYVLAISGVDTATRHARAEELMDIIGLDTSMLDAYPRELSGGQQQRVGLARAIAPRPNVILMDEPLSAVDEIARSGLQDELLRIHHTVGSTIILVTHDIGEALKLGSTVILMREGRIEQIGSPDDLVLRPQSAFVKEFLGLKGFTARLDEAVLWDLYNRELASGGTLDALNTQIGGLLEE